MVNDENMFEWEVALFGPPETLYEGGYFKVRLVKFIVNADIFFRVSVIKLGFVPL